MILVTGGTGLVGSHLLYALLQDHPRVRATHRKDSDLNAVRTVFSYYTDDPDEAFNRIDWVLANIIDIPALTAAFKGITKVYHAAAYISFDPRHFHKLKKANIEGTANVVNLCLDHGIEKLCHVSSVATLGRSINGSLVSETTPWNPEDDNSVYAITKYGAEMEVWRGTQEGLSAVIVNPGVILGSGHWNSGSGRIIRRAVKGIPYYPSGGIGIVGVQDVVRAMILLVERPVQNERFVLVASNMSYKAFLTDLTTRFDNPPPKKKIPKWSLHLLCFLDAFSHALFGTKRRLLPATIRSMSTKTFYDSAKIRTQLDFEFTPVPETLDRIAANYCKES